jgi:hypothetical protein
MGSCLGVLLSFDEGDPENMLVTHEDLAPFLPPGVIPFADDGGGDFICFKYEQAEATPQVVYWHHGEREVVPLADTFTGFLEMLHERPPRPVDVSSA